MDTAINVFLITVAIVGGILSPLLVIMFLSTLGKAMEALAGAMNAKTEEIKKRPPFDEVEVNVSPATNVMTARFLKNGVIIWQGSSSRREMVENNRLTFTTEEPE